jgi:hypothetical protein
VKARRPVLEEREGFKTEFEDGRFIRRKIKRMEQVVDWAPLLNEDGSPVFETVRENGEERRKPAMVSVPRFEEYDAIKLRPQERAKLGADGKPITRLGVRYEQLTLLAIAVLAEGLSAANSAHAGAGPR